MSEVVVSQESRVLPGAVRTAVGPHEAETACGRLVGRSPREVRRVGTGNPLVLIFAEGASGESRLWSWSAVWRLETSDEVLAGCEDEDDAAVGASIARLVGRRLVAVEVARPSLATDFVFEGGYRLRTFPTFTKGEEHWVLEFSPGEALTAGPGQQFYRCVSEGSGQ